MLATVRNVLVLIVGHHVAWVGLMASYSMLFVILDKNALPYIPHALAITVFLLLVVPAFVFGLVLPYLFVGAKRLWWCWALSLSLLAYALATLRLYPSSHSTAAAYALWLLAHYLPMVVVGVAATVLLWHTRCHATQGV